MRERRQRLSFIVDVCYVFAWVALLYVVANYVVRWLMPVLLGFVIAWMMRPAAGFIARHSGMSARGASIVSAVLFFGAIGLLAWLLGLFVYAQAQGLGEKLPVLYEQAVEPFLRDYHVKLTQWMNKLLPRAGIGLEQVFGVIDETLRGLATKASEWGVGLLGRLLKALPGFLLALVFTIMCTVLTCAQYERVCAFVLRQIPLRLQEQVLGLRDFIAKTMVRTARAYALLTLLTFAMLLLGLWALGVRHAVTASVLVALLDVLPVVGSGTVLVPWGIYLLLSGKYVTGAGMLVLWVVIAAAKEVLEPKIVGEQIGQNPLVTLTAMYAGMHIAGFWGLVMAPVVCLAAEYLQRQGMFRLYR